MRLFARITQAEFFIYFVAVAAPGFVAVAQFIAQIALLRFGTTTEFGLFSFLLVCTLFGYGLSNAIVSTPFTVSLKQGAVFQVQSDVFFCVNFMLCLAFTAILAVICVLLEAPPWGYVLAVNAGAALCRWFGRAVAYAQLRPKLAAVSDIVYSTVLLTATVTLVYSKSLSPLALSVAFVAANFVSLIVFGRDFFCNHYRTLIAPVLAPYVSVWEAQSRWMLLGVASAEATSNAHAYIVSIFWGPAAYAVIANAALLTRPTSLAVTSLTQLVRPTMYNLIEEGKVPQAVHTRNKLLLSLVAVSTLNAILILVVLQFFSSLMVQEQYDLGEFKLVSALLVAQAVVVVAQAPYNVFLQAAKQYRDLAFTSLLSALLSILLVFLIAWHFHSALSVLGVILGQLTMTIGVHRLARRVEQRTI
jgi:O-antigen/teichoic acid export membrane protein